MKRINGKLLLILLFCSVPFVLASGQDKKAEKKIMVVVEDGSGNKTLLDSVIPESHAPGKIKLKDGSVVYITEPDGDLKEVSGAGKVIVTVNSDEEGEKNIEKKVFVITSDSLDLATVSAGDDGHIWILSHSCMGPERHITISSSDDDTDEAGNDESITIRHGSMIRKGGGSTYTVTLDDVEEMDSDATKYVIARDGVVVTVECDDEKKAEEIIKLVKEKLEINKSEKK